MIDARKLHFVAIGLLALWGCGGGTDSASEPQATRRRSKRRQPVSTRRKRHLQAFKRLSKPRIGKPPLSA